VLDAEGAAAPAFQALSKRGTIVGMVIGVDVVIIVFLMVTKPAL